MLDVSSANEIKNVFKKIVSEVAPIDILVDNAGLAHYDLAENITAEQVVEMIDINLKGTIFCTQEVLSSMKERNYGSIINVVSTAGVEGKIKESVYCASKFGVRGFTESIIKELNDSNIHVHGIYMSGMTTSLWDGKLDEEGMAGFMEPDDVADIIIANTNERLNLSIPEVIIEKH